MVVTGCKVAILAVVLSTKQLSSLLIDVIFNKNVIFENILWSSVHLDI